MHGMGDWRSLCVRILPYMRKAMLGLQVCVYIYIGIYVYYSSLLLLIWWVMCIGICGIAIYIYICTLSHMIRRCGRRSIHYCCKRSNHYWSHSNVTFCARVGLLQTSSRVRKHIYTYKYIFLALSLSFFPSCISVMRACIYTLIMQNNHADVICIYYTHFVIAIHIYYSSEFPIVDGHLSADCYLQSLDICYTRLCKRFAQRRRLATNTSSPRPLPRKRSLMELDGALGNVALESISEDVPRSEAYDTEERLAVDDFEYMCFHCPYTKLVCYLVWCVLYVYTLIMYLSYNAYHILIILSLFTVTNDWCEKVRKAFARLLQNDFRDFPGMSKFGDVPRDLLQSETCDRYTYVKAICTYMFPMCARFSYRAVQRQIFSKERKRERLVFSTL